MASTFSTVVLDLVIELSDELELVPVLFIDLEAGELLAVLPLQVLPEELDAVEVGAVADVEEDFDVVLLQKVFDFSTPVDRGIVEYQNIFFSRS